MINVKGKEETIRMNGCEVVVVRPAKKLSFEEGIKQLERIAENIRKGK